MKKIRESFGTFAWISEVAEKGKWLVIALACIQTLQGLAAVIKTLLLGQAVNCVAGKDRHGFLFYLGGFIGLVVLQIAMSLLYRYLNEYTLSDVENRLKSRMLRALLKSRYADVTRTHSGEWMNRLANDTSVIAGAYVGTIPEFAGLAVRLLGALAAIAWIEPRLLLFLVAGGILILAFIRYFRRIMKQLHKNIQEADGRLRVFLQERLGSLMIIRTFGQEKNTSARADSMMADHKAARMKRNRFLNVFYGGYSAGINFLHILGIFFCGFGILNGTMSYGNLVAVLQLLEEVQSPFANITGFLPRYYAMIASAERLMEAESLEEEAADGLSESALSFYNREFKGISLRNVSFRYPPSLENPEAEMPAVFEDLSFDIVKGEHTAFTGPSGCGKSTVLKLMMSLYPPESGDIRILTETGELSLSAAYRDLFAYVPQGNQLMTGSIREAIAFGDEEKMKDEAGIQEAMKIACAEGFVNALEKGPDTLLGERGAGLSEGQMQRIAIARAIFSGRPILLLDEATAALDEAAANQLLNNLKTMTDKTVIMVTHRTGNMRTFSKEIAFTKDGVTVKDLNTEEAAK